MSVGTTVQMSSRTLLPWYWRAWWPGRSRNRMPATTSAPTTIASTTTAAPNISQ